MVLFDAAEEKTRLFIFGVTLAIDGHVGRLVCNSPMCLPDGNPNFGA